MRLGQRRETKRCRVIHQRPAECSAEMGRDVHVRVEGPAGRDARHAGKAADALQDVLAAAGELGLHLGHSLARI